ncbi:MAG: beta strand repeat-containing protein [Shimia sp.]
MAAIDYVVRNGDGRLARGTITELNGANVIQVDTNSEVSLNLLRGHIHDYRRIGDTLEIELENGQIVRLQGFFQEGIITESRLYLSANGELVEITFTESWGRTNIAQFDGGVITEARGDLLFEGAANGVITTETTMAAAPLFVGGGFGAGGLAAAGIAGLGLVGAAAGGGGGGGTTTLEGMGTWSFVMPEGGAVTGNAQNGLSMAGEATPGATVTLTLQGPEGTDPVTVETVADENGYWVLLIDPADLPPDGSYTTTISVADPNGTTESITGPAAVIDTDAPSIAVSAPLGTGGVVLNGSNHGDPLLLTGQGEPGSTVVVTIAGTEYPTVVDGAGNWTVNIDTSLLPEGEYNEPITIVTTDPSGNTTTVTDSLIVDTVPDAVMIDANAVAGDDIVNAMEAGGPVAVSGTATPGAVVTITLANVSLEATADASGVWSATIPAGTLDGGQYDTELTASVTDTGGNVTTDSRPVRIDTKHVTTVDTASVEGDGVVNVAEAADGITLSGTTARNAHVIVSFAGNDYDLGVIAGRDWSVDVPAGNVPMGTGIHTVSVTSTDAAGNVATASGSLSIDRQMTVALDATQAGDNIITASEAVSGVTITGTTEPGNDVSVTMAGVTQTATVTSAGTFTAIFGSGALPSGTQPIDVSVSATDAAGNSATDQMVLQLDTSGFVTFSTTPVEGDDIVNLIEASDGVVITGETEPGSSVTLVFDGNSYTAVVDAAGGWSVSIPSGAIPADQALYTLTATATTAAGNVSTAQYQITIDTEITAIVVTENAVGGDGILNAAEIGVPLVFGGTGEPGATITAVLDGQIVTTTVGTDGAWTLTIDSSTLSGGTYPAELEITMVDLSGNSTTTTTPILVDTDAPALGFSGAPIEGDDIINGVEAVDGVTVRGSADPGAIVEVEMAGVTTVVVASSTGAWNAYFAGNEIPTGEQSVTITATTSDAAGNVTVLTDSVSVDTVLRDFAWSPGQIEGDDVISASELSDGVAVSGMVEPGSSVEIIIGAMSYSAAVAADGSWSLILPPTAFPTGEQMVSMIARATDAAGNTQDLSRMVEVDTLVNSLAITDLPIPPGFALNIAGVANGVTVGGTVEANSTLVITYDTDKVYNVTADASGDWTLNIPGSDMRFEEYTATIEVVATDPHGNTATTSGSFDVDATGPEQAPIIIGLFHPDTGPRSLSALSAPEEPFTVDEVTLAGDSQAVMTVTTLDQMRGEQQFDLQSTVSDGSNLVVTATDDNGNSASTMLVLEWDGAPKQVDLANPGLDGFEITAIDLDEFSDAELTLTPELVASMAQYSDKFVVHGGVDDTVTMLGATQNMVDDGTGNMVGETKQIGSNTFDVYTLGTDGVTVIVDQDVQLIT